MHLGCSFSGKKKRRLLYCKNAVHLYRSGNQCGVLICAISVFRQFLFIGLTIGSCFQGALCVLITFFTLTGAISSVIWVIFELILISKSLTDSDVWLKVCDRACSERTAVILFIVLFRAIRVFWGEWGDIWTSNKNDQIKLNLWQMWRHEDFLLWQGRTNVVLGWRYQEESEIPCHKCFQDYQHAQIFFIKTFSSLRSNSWY